MNKRKSRSDAYQWMICEVTVSDELMASFPNEESLGSRLDPFGRSERMDELEDELKKLFWEVADKVMTPRQKEIMHMRAAGMTQMEIADKLEVNQSSVTKSLNGNVDYKKKNADGTFKVYGGAVKKLKKVMAKNPRVQEILAELSELRSGD